MKSTICLSTGMLYKLHKDRNEILPELLKFKPDGIEICFMRYEHIFSFHPTNSELEKLKKLKFVSIHAPSLYVKWGENPESHQALEEIEKIYHRVGAKNVVFHDKRDDDLSVVKKYNFTASIENDDSRYYLNTPEKMEKALRKYPEMKFTLDFAHVLSINSDLIQDFINNFKDKIIEIHMSWLGRKIKDHKFIHKHNSKKIRELLKLIKQLNEPIVFESVAQNNNEKSLIKDEIDYINRI